MKNMSKWWVLAFLLLGSGAAHGLEFHLRGDRLSMKADGARLTDILRQFARVGVRVRVDPDADAIVRANLRDEDVQKALDKLLEPFGYVLIWDVIEGPIGSIPKLAEIQVFKPGQKAKIQPLPGIEPNFPVARGPGGGPEFVLEEILIGFRPGTRRDDFDRLIAQIGGTVISSVPGMGVYQIRLSPGANVLDLVEQLKRNPLVAQVEPNYITETGRPVVEGPSSRAEESAAAPKLADGVSPVAILDSGVMALAGLSNAVLGSFDAVNPDQPAGDRLGHGTQMAMIASGAIAPGGTENSRAGVPVVAIRAFDDNGNASNFSLMRSIAYALDSGARVINMSWGTETSSEFLRAAIQYAQSRGAVVVAAAGNEPTGRPVYPAAYQDVVAVSAVDSAGSLWERSNTGDFVSFAAPGSADFPIGYKGPAGAYAGTSISSAYVSRSLALYFAAHPSASAQDAVRALQAAATDAGAAGRDSSFGFGLIDAAALNAFLR